MKRNILFILLLCSVNWSIGQDSTAISNADLDMITNRPGATEASRAVYHKGFQIEMGLEYGKIPEKKGSAEHSQYILLPNIGFQYGVSKNVELRVFATNYATRSYVNGGLTQFVFNLSDIYVGAKINVVKSKGWVPEIALLINQGFPSNTVDVRKNWPTKAVIAWSYSLPHNFGVSGNLGYINLKESFEQQITYDHSFLYTLNVGYAIHDGLGVFVEAYGEEFMEAEINFPLNFDAGVWYRFNNKFQIDASAGYGTDLGNIYVNAGFSYLFLK